MMDKPTNIVFQMDKKMLKSVLPHRDPFLLIDEGKVGFDYDDNPILAEASYEIKEDWEIIKGHFPDAPVMPGTLTTESMAQCADLILMSLEGSDGKIPYLIAINQMRFIRPAACGDTLKLKAELLDSFDEGVYDVAVSANVNDEKIAQGVLTLCLR